MKEKLTAKNKKIFEKIMSRFAEAVNYKIKRDMILYGICALEVGNMEQLDEIIEIRKMLDKDFNWEDMIREMKVTKVGNSDTVTNIRK